MARPRKTIKASEDFIINSVLLAAAISTGISLYTEQGWLPVGVKLGILGASLIGLAKQNLWRSSSYDPTPRRLLREMQSLQRIPSQSPDVDSWLLRWKPEKPQPADEFVFYGDLLLVPVLEEEFRAFMKTAVRRQNNALYGGRAWRIRGKDGSFSRIKINWVLSENYFVNHHRPRFPLELYRSIMIILAATRLRRCVARSGKSDYLVGEWSAEGYVERAIGRWLKYHQSPTSGKRRSFLARLTN
jgi:hypothetical protein